jgi:WD40 repeat protein
MFFVCLFSIFKRIVNPGVEMIANGGSIYNLALSLGDKFLVAGSGDGFVRIYNVKTGERVFEDHSHNSTTRKVRFSKSNLLNFLTCQIKVFFMGQFVSKGGATMFFKNSELTNCKAT